MKKDFYKHVFQVTSVVILLVLSLSLATDVLAEGDPIRLGDVIRSNGSGGIVGHNAYWDGVKLLEVRTGESGMNKTCVYNNRNLKEVKGFGYHGARYDKKADARTNYKAVESGRGQANYKATYSLLKPNLRYATSATKAWVLNYNTSYLEYKTMKSNSVLRCDFFVSASYKQAGGRNLSGWPHEPDAVWNRLPDAR